MEAMEIVLAAARDLSYVSYAVVNHPIYSTICCLLLSLSIFKFYCKLTAGICDSDQDMTGKTVFITGATAGVGKATAKDLARRNARVILACRNTEKAHRVAEEITSETGNKNVIVKHLDLASFETVRKCAEDVLKTEKKLHVLINNAGIFDEGRKLTEDGYEYTLQSNHFGHFLLTLSLLDLLRKSAPSRIINVASSSYAWGKLDLNDLPGKSCNQPMARYGRSKLANILFTRELASRLANSGVTVNALNPGLVNTDIMKFQALFMLFVKFCMLLVGKTCEEGAQTTIYLAVHPDLQKTTGKYFVDCREEKIVGQQALDKTLASQLFETSEKITEITFKNT